MKRPGKMIRQVLATAAHKPVTVRYPFVKVTMCDRFRGKLDFDAAKCIGCKLCMRDCPTNAINIRKVADKVFECDVDMSRCIYCAQCVDSCPKKALSATTEFELAQLTRDKLQVVYKGPVKPAAEPAAAIATAEPKTTDHDPSSR